MCHPDACMLCVTQGNDQESDKEAVKFIIHEIL